MASEHYDPAKDGFTEAEPTISLFRFSQVLKRYRFTIVLCIAAIMIAYGIVAIGAFLMAPAQRVTMQPFRLEFPGATGGEYPNKTKFNPADIVSTPILSRVYRDNQLSNYLPFGAFSRSIFVLESNPEYDKLVAEYQSRIADRSLSSIDRTAIEKDFEAKRQAILKNEFAVTLTQPDQTRRIPDTIARKVVSDTLTDWADFAVNQQHVTMYELSLPSVQILNVGSLQNDVLVNSTLVLRGQVDRVIDDSIALAQLPGATLARTPNDHMSLEEIQVRLNEIMRYRVEPLIPQIFSSGLITDRAATLRFLQTQLDYDKRALDKAERLIDGTRQALAAYEQPALIEPASTASEGQKTEAAKGRNSNPEVVPQLNDTFLERLITMSGRGLDVEYRQRLVNDYRSAVSHAIPLQQAVTYDGELIAAVQKANVGGSSANAESVRTQLEQVRADIADLIKKMNDLFGVVNVNMTPATQLYSMTGTPSTRILRGLSLQRVALYGLLVFLISIPTVIIACLLHYRIHQEEIAEDLAMKEAAQT